MRHPETVIEIARRVPVEYLEVDPGPAALDRDRCEPRHQPSSDPTPARRFGDIKVFEIHPRAAEPGRKSRMKQRKARRLAVQETEDRLKLAVWSEPVPAQVVFGRDDGNGGPFISCEFADQLQH